MKPTDIVMLIFTGVIAVSTVFYTVYSIRLWRATRASVDLARYTAFMNLMIQLGQYTEDAKRKGQPEAGLLEQFVIMVGEFGFEQFLVEMDIKNDPVAREYFGKIEGMLRAINLDPNSVPWFRPILKKLKG